MLERLIRGAPAPLQCLAVIFLSAVLFGGRDAAFAAEGPADIELRKSFRPARRSGSRTPGAMTRSPEGQDPTAADTVHEAAPVRLGAVAEALGEQIQTSGTLHLPGVGTDGVALDVATTPILETAAGRHLIIDRDRSIDQSLVDRISRRWPGYSVVQPPAGANLREVIGSTLAAAGYDSVLRSTPLIFGRGPTLRVTPDFVVLRSERDLLEGETRAISVVEPAEALPSELRELAGEHRVRIVELTPDGAPAGADRAPWSAAAGRVTAVEAARLTPIVEKIAGALGLSVVRGVLLPAAVGLPGVRADLAVSGGGRAVLVFEDADPRLQEPLVGRGYTAVWLNSASDLSAAIAALLRRYSIPAIGPTVELYRSPPPGASPRFVISVPGWLAEFGGRRLLITGSALPPLVRLYLTREDIDIFEYQIR